MLLDKIYFACNAINSNSLEFLSDFTSGTLISMKNTNIVFLRNSHTARKSRKMCVFRVFHVKKAKTLLPSVFNIL